jgi:hypothetical protein
MKRSSFILLMIAINWASCVNKDPKDAAADRIMADTAKYTSIQWTDSVVNFGSINMGEQIKIAFHFRNTGNQPLFLANVKAGCGCTVPDYTKGAILPGGEGEVTGAFDSNKAHAGEVRKAIFVTTNTHNKKEHTLIFTGLIKEAPAK